MSWVLYVSYFILIFASIRLIIAVINLFSRLYLCENFKTGDTMISVLIPARNEAAQLPALLEALDRSAYLSKEVIIYDDMSTDGSREFLMAAKQRFHWLKVIEGDRLPQGWTGKNHACYQLARHASGDILLFLDADVLIRPTALSKAVATIEKERLHLLSVFPQQIMMTNGERLTVPLMNWILLSLLPMVLIKKSRQPSLAAANGQFMMFRAAEYRNHQWHEQFKSSVVEDILISRAVKKTGLTTMTYLGNSDVCCRMYHNGRESIQGFSKNIHQFFGGSYLIMILFVLVISSGFLWILFLMPPVIVGVYLGIIMLTTGIITHLSRQNIFYNLIFQPFRTVTLFILGWMSLKNHFNRKTHWKGRDIIIK